MRYQQLLVYIDAVARAGSIRRAAQTLAITSTALNRRILSVEEELGAPLFERLPGGVRLSAAGEMFLDFARRELTETDRLHARIADLASVQRGHINIACGQAFMEYPLPTLITRFRASRPAVTFGLRICNRFDAALKLERFEADIAMVFEPQLTATIDVLGSYRCAPRLLCRCHHPLTAYDPVRLSACFDYPMALPTHGNGIRHLLEARAARLGRPLPLTIESDSAVMLERSIGSDDTITFALPAGEHEALPENVVERAIDARDLLTGEITLLRLRGRTLPVAAARFAESLRSALGSESE